MKVSVRVTDLPVNKNKYEAQFRILRRRMGIVFQGFSKLLQDREYLQCSILSSSNRRKKPKIYKANVF